MKPQSPENSGETNSAAELRGIIPSPDESGSGLFSRAFGTHEIVPAKPVLSCSTYIPISSGRSLLKFESHE